jgi:hypothetical protein
MPEFSYFGHFPHKPFGFSAFSHKENLATSYNFPSSAPSSEEGEDYGDANYDEPFTSYQSFVYQPISMDMSKPYLPPKPYMAPPKPYVAPTRPQTTTTQKPYVAPAVTQPFSQAPIVVEEPSTTSRRPYVAPTVTSQRPIDLELAATTVRPFVETELAFGSKPGDFDYQPEFDIDVKRRK